MPIYVARISFFVKTLYLVIAFCELRPGSNERYENSTFYGVNTDKPFHVFYYDMADIQKNLFMKYKEEYQKFK